MNLPTIISVITLIKNCKKKVLLFIKDKSINDDFLLNLLFTYYIVLNECLDIIENLLTDDLKKDGTFHDTDKIIDLHDCIAASIETEAEISRYLSFELH